MEPPYTYKKVIRFRSLFYKSIHSLTEMQKILCEGDTGMTGGQAAKILSVFMKYDKNKDGRFDYTGMFQHI